MNRRTKLATSLGTVLTVAACLAALVPIAQAASLKAQIYLVQATIPKTLTEKSLIAFARRNANKLLRETPEGEVKTRKWKADMVVSFSRPVDDMEFQVLFYDIHDGPRRFVNDMSIMVNDRDQKTFVQKVTLPRPSFKPNRQMEMVVTVKREEVGRLKFGVVGEEIRRSGEVSFSDGER
jgi:hypothetical protein